MNVRTMRAGVIGLGVGERHVTGYGQIADCEVTAICDRDPVKLAEVGDRQGIACRETDWRKIVGHPDIDLVSICSYDDTHTEQAVAAFGNGKHVMIEKPIALNRREAEAILRAQQDSGCLITSNFILRQSPRFQEVWQMARDGAFGELFYMEGDYVHQILWKILEGWRGKMDFYCVTYGGGIHLIDLMRWISGQEVTEVAGMGGKVLTRGSRYRYPDTIVNLHDSRTILLQRRQQPLARSVRSCMPCRFMGARQPSLTNTPMPACTAAITMRVPLSRRRIPLSPRVISCQILSLRYAKDANRLSAPVTCFG